MRHDAHSSTIRYYHMLQLCGSAHACPYQMAAVEHAEYTRGIKATALHCMATPKDATVTADSPLLRRCKRTERQAIESNASHRVPSLSAPCPGASSIAQPPAHPMEHVQEVAALSSCPQDHSRSGSGGEWTRSSSRCNLSDGEAWGGRVRRACSGSCPPTARRAGDGRGTGGTPVSEVVQSSWKPPPH